MTFAHDGMIHDVAIYRQVVEKDALKSSVIKYKREPFTPCNGRVVPATSETVIAFRRRGLDVDTTVYFFADPKITAEHIVVFTRANQKMVMELRGVTNQHYLDRQWIFHGLTRSVKEYTFVD